VCSLCCTVYSFFLIVGGDIGGAIAGVAGIIGGKVWILPFFD
jgi:hypothetical protein